MAYIKPVSTLGLYSRQRKACGVRSINPASLDQLFIPSYAVQYALGVRPGYVGPGCGKWLRAASLGYIYQLSLLFFHCSEQKQCLNTQAPNACRAPHCPLKLV